MPLATPLATDTPDRWRSLAGGGAELVDLLVAATGTGKTVMAALDYASLSEQLDLPDGDGIALGIQLRQRWPKVKVAILP